MESTEDIIKKLGPFAPPSSKEKASKQRHTRSKTFIFGKSSKNTRKELEEEKDASVHQNFIFTPKKVAKQIS